MKRRSDINGRYIKDHGMRNTKIYYVWCSMKSRCNNQHDKSYGGKGISVCDEWCDSFSVFYEWAKENGYAEGLTIDRIDCGKGYSPENCRWVTQAVQNRNYSRNHFITYNGITKCLKDWADELGIKPETIYMRLKRGKTIEQAFDNHDGRKTRWQTITSQSSST